MYASSYVEPMYCSLYFNSVIRDGIKPGHWNGMEKMDWKIAVRLSTDRHRTQ